MTQPAVRKGPWDLAKNIVEALEKKLGSTFVDIRMEVPDEFHPLETIPVLLVADDGQFANTGGPWLAGRDLLQYSIRLTCFANGRTEARVWLLSALELICNNADVKKSAGYSRVENIPAVLDTRDRETGAYLASVTLPILARPK